MERTTVNHPVEASQAAVESGDKRQVTRAAGVAGSGTLLSRVFGFVRDIFIAHLFGAGMAADAFFVAFRLPNMLRSLLGEGALSAAYVPVFTRIDHAEGRESAWRFVNVTLTVLGVVLVLLCLLAVTFSPVFVRLMAPGFARIPEKLALTVSLTRIMFPYLFFISLVALLSGTLNSLGHFAMPALSPVFLNLWMITAILVIVPLLPVPVYGLAIGVLLGGITQLLVLLRPLRNRGFRFRLSWQWNHPGVKRIATLMVPALFGIGVSEINVFVDTLLASLLPEGSVSYLYYANRLVQFPQGIFGAALGVAVLPAMSRHAARNEGEGMKETLRFALGLVFFLSLPATVGLAVLGTPIINVLFERGKFDPVTTQGTAWALLFFSLGLCAFTAVKVIAPVFYALQDIRTPVGIAACAMLLNIVLNLMLMGPLKHGGLALATSLSSVFNATLLMVELRRRMGRLGSRRLVKSLVRSGVASLLMGGAIFALAVGFFDPARPLIVRTATLMGIVVLGLGVYTAVCRWLGSEELRYVVAALHRKGQ